MLYLKYFFQVSDHEFVDIGRRILIRINQVSDTLVQIFTHCNLTNDDVRAIIFKLKYVIKEYDNILFFDPSTGVMAKW